MLILNTDVFNEVVTGTATTWTSYSMYDAKLGAAEALTVMAYFTLVSGTTPRINLFGDDSNDGRNWVLGTGAILSTSVNLANSLLLYGFKGSQGAFTRFRFTLSGTSPQCRVKLTVTGRSL